MRRLSPVLLAAAALAGCGPAANSSNGTPREVFAGTCGSCHTLKAAGTTGSFGPNLDDLKPSIATVEAKIKSGGGGMPAGLLTGDKAQQIAAYVANSAGD